ncbi:MAG: CopD family protein, partial [Pseudomonadota bacterium]
MNDVPTNSSKNAGLRAYIALACFIVLAAIVWLLELGDLYSWLKAFHLIAVISWMAGLVYLPRLFVYHADSEIGSDQSATFKLMEKRLLKLIMTPAMIIAWVFGLALAFQTDAFIEIWFLLKFFLVLAMSGFHGFLAKSVRVFANDKNIITSGKWRLYNENTTVLMI